MFGARVLPLGFEVVLHLPACASRPAARKAPRAGSRSSATPSPAELREAVVLVPGQRPPRRRVEPLVLRRSRTRKLPSSPKKSSCARADPPAAKSRRPRRRDPARQPSRDRRAVRVARRLSVPARFAFRGSRSTATLATSFDLVRPRVLQKPGPRNSAEVPREPAREVVDVILGHACGSASPPRGPAFGLFHILSR